MHPIQIPLFDLSKKKEDKIIDLVSRRMGVPYQKLLGYDNSPKYSDARRICWYLLRRPVGMTQERIAHLFGHRKQHTISVGEQYIRRLRSHDHLVQDLKTLEAVCKALK